MLSHLLIEIRRNIIDVMKTQLKNEWKVEALWSCYYPDFLPPQWALDEYKKTSISYQTNAFNVKCITMNTTHEYLDMVLMNREPTNIANQPGKFYSAKMKECFGYAESGYKKAFKLSNQQKLPPNFATLCRTMVQPDNLDLEFINYVESCYIQVVNLIGFAFDSISQPDFIYFIEGNCMQYFNAHLENMFKLIFAAFIESKCSVLVSAQVGGNEFTKWFPGEFEAYLRNHFYPSLKKAWKFITLRPFIIALSGNPKQQTLERLDFACRGANVIGCGRFPQNVTQHLPYNDNTGVCSLHEVKDLGHNLLNTTYKLKDALFVNAWDPHCIVGNGNSKDDSLDGYIGRNTGMATKSFPPTNPHTKILDANRILRE